MEDHISITAEAAAQIKQQLEARQTPNAYLRLGLKSGGCNSFTYLIRFEEEIKDNDQVFVSQDIKVVVDPKSFTYLKGCVLDWDSSLMKQGFTFTNPNAKSGCGCGKSFGTI